MQQRGIVIPSFFWQQWGMKRLPSNKMINLMMIYFFTFFQLFENEDWRLTKLHFWFRLVWFVFYFHLLLLLVSLQKLIWYENCCENFPFLVVQCPLRNFVYTHTHCAVCLCVIIVLFLFYFWLIRFFFTFCKCRNKLFSVFFILNFVNLTSMSSGWFQIIKAKLGWFQNGSLSCFDMFVWYVFIKKMRIRRWSAKNVNENAPLHDAY